MTTHCRHSAHKVEDRQIWDKLRAQLSGKLSIDSGYFWQWKHDSWHQPRQFCQGRVWKIPWVNWQRRQCMELSFWSKKWINSGIVSINLQLQPGESWRNHLPQRENIRKIIRLRLPSENHSKSKRKTTISYSPTRFEAKATSKAGRYTIPSILAKGCRDDLLYPPSTYILSTRGAELTTVLWNLEWE